eukprot:TRINITY_DN634_c0_g1_i1.p1 TRINITY_DN634_c0_g1~~TRINITY_DN634_c0_g1_i1.p1  ORF type:complete len:101 (+),score=42.23 TRINITY_DN634_c0_g1_i1:97-399(+)
MPGLAKAPPVGFSNPLTYMRAVTYAPIRPLVQMYARSAAGWGVVGGIFVLYLTQPYELWTRIPIIGSYYVDPVRDQKAKEARENAAAEARKKKEEEAAAK